jgi:hypothetical protein
MWQVAERIPELLNISSPEFLSVNRCYGVRRLAAALLCPGLPGCGSYVHENAVHHGLVSVASNYPCCSAGWFEQRAEPSFRKTILSFPCDTINVRDDFVVSADFLAAK